MLIGPFVTQFLLITISIEIAKAKPNFQYAEYEDMVNILV